MFTTCRATGIGSWEWAASRAATGCRPNSRRCMGIQRRSCCSFARRSFDMATDPVCGMTVDPAKAGATVEHEGKKYFFCCKHCAAKFQAEPQKYLQPAIDPVCGMKVEPANAAPEIVRDAPGSCPKCGMALVPMVPTVPVATEYTCPMHPEVRSNRPGNCPKCGMALVPVLGAQEDNAELRDHTRRFWVSAALSVPLVFIAMAPHFGLQG